jgi:glycosyltransferase involved in cell wall biosynthesis
VIDGVNGYLIRKRGDWARRLRELTEDDAAREEMGAKARETARAHTIGAGWRKWASAYEELL